MFALRSLVTALILVAAAPVVAGETVLLDFTAPWCGPCQRMKPLVEQLAAMGYPVRQVNIDQRRDLASRYRVTNIPCFVMVADGVEVDRVVGMASSQRLLAMLQQANVARPGENTQTARGQSPSPQQHFAQPSPSASTSYAPHQDAQVTEGSYPSSLNQPTADPFSTRAAGGEVTDFAAQPQQRGQLQQRDQPQQNAPVQTVGHAARPDAGDELTEKLLRSTVRLKVDDPDGHSFGTGTIVDARGGEALVLTCGHIFRDSQGQGPIQIDLLGESGDRVRGKLISFDLKRDLALVSFRTSQAITFSPVAPEGHEVKSGERVINVGCNGGQHPTALRSRVTATDKYLGPRNIEVAGMPVQGRSGGGLFDQQGRLIGVCFAADPRDNEGVYAHVASIHAELRRLGLMDVCAAKAPSTSQQAQGVPQPTSPPEMPPEMPRDKNPAIGSIRTVAGGSTFGNEGPMSPRDRAALEEIAERSGEAEVICIIRPLDDPQAKSEILVLNRASAAFVARLAEAAQRGEERRLTSLEVRRPTASPAAKETAVPWYRRKPRAHSDPQLPSPATAERLMRRPGQ